MKVIDPDSHSRLRTEDYFVEPEYMHLRPRAYVDAKGTRRDVFNNKVVRMLTAGQLKLADEAVKRDWRAAYYDGSVRHRNVTEAGIDLQFVSTGIVGEFNYIDAGAGAAFCRAANNFIYERFMQPYPETFTGLPQLPLQDIREAVKELERCVKDLGMRTFMMPTNWNGIDMADPYWWNFYDRIRGLGITGIMVHAGPLMSPWVGQERLGVLGSNGSTGTQIVSMPFEYSANILNLIFGGMMDTFPDFRFAFLEVGAEFAILLKHRMEENLGQIDYLRDMLAQPLERYFDRLYFFVDDLLLADNGKRLRCAIEELGADHLFYGSDYPHSDSHLDACAVIKGLGSLSAEEKEMILGGNMETLMGGTLV